MKLLRNPMPRRTFLRGLGASISIPVLDAMTPALGALSKPGSAMPLRIGYAYSPNGIIKERWRPTIAGADFELTDVLKPWEPFRDQLLVLTHLNNGDAESVSGHVGGSTMFLTGTEPNKSLSEIQANVSVDQMLARELGRETPLGSLQVCIENAAELAGQSSGGYSSAYTNTISWSSPTTPLPMEHRPREIFERLFGDGGTDPEARKNRIRRQKSILDFVKGDVARVKKQLGHVDSLKLDEFSDALRDVEFRVQKAEEKVDIDLPEVERPVGIPEHEEHIRLMYDLLLLAFQTDTTRVFTYMIAREYSELVYTNLGHTDPYHPLTHHRGSPVRKQQAGDIDVYHAELFAEFLAKMRATTEVDGSSLLDNSILIYGAGLGDGDIHSQWNVPVALLGGGGGRLKGGRHLVYEEGTPLANLHVALLNKIGIPTESFGGRLGFSTGELDLDARL
ncbi:MAG: DUF1552 domain-containing protein [Gammaproteobacteria bacterium]|nr:DUF1552 domain-containing protein [Gammaproteobacteria bacterium]